MRFAARSRDNSRVQIRSWPEAATPTALRRQILDLQRQAWPDDDPARSATHDPRLDPVSYALIDADRVVAALDVLSKTTVHRGRAYRACGLSAVVVDLARRGQGLGHRLVVAARRSVEDSGADLVLFTCDRPLQAFYERAGFDILPGTVVVGGTAQQPFPSDLPEFDKVTLASFFSTTARAHRDDFVGCRIELYPGEIDKLW